jgi:hypothetical protein
MVGTATTATAASPQPAAHLNRLDTISALLVLALTLAALLAGLLLRDSVESRTKTYTGAGGLTVRYPQTWQLDDSDAANGSVLVRNRVAGGFPTTLQLQRVAVDASAPVTDVLALVANDMAVNRGQDLTAFKVFDITPGLTVKGLPASAARYVYVDVPEGALRESLPSVVLGDDYLVRKGGTVYVFTLNATESRRADALPLFDRFVASAELP